MTFHEILTISLSVGALIAGIAALVVVLQAVLRNACRPALAAVCAEPRVIALIGDDIKASSWVFGSINIGLFGGTARLSFSVQGTRGRAKVRTRVVLPFLRWRWETRFLVVTIDGMAPLVLVDGPSWLIGWK